MPRTCSVPAFVVTVAPSVATGPVLARLPQQRLLQKPPQGGHSRAHPQPAPPTAGPAPQPATPTAGSRELGKGAGKTRMRGWGTRTEALCGRGEGWSPTQVNLPANVRTPDATLTAPAGGERAIVNMTEKHSSTVWTHHTFRLPHRHCYEYSRTRFRWKTYFQFFWVYTWEGDCWVLVLCLTISEQS